jgi:hypothetical protein
MAILKAVVVRYWLAAALIFAVVLAVSLIAGVLLPGVAAWRVVAVAVLGYALAVVADVLPPGRSPARPLPPDGRVRRAPAPRVRISKIGLSRSSAGRGQRRKPGVVVAVAGTLALAAGAFIVGDFTVDVSSGRRPADAADRDSAADQPGLRAPPSPSTMEVASVPSIAAGATVARPTSLAATDGWLNGVWHVTDAPEGVAAGRTFSFDVTLTESASAVSGQGDGLALEGSHQGDIVSLAFTEGGSSGRFTWRLQPDGSMSGRFEQLTGGRSSGTSVAKRRP